MMAPVTIVVGALLSAAGLGQGLRIIQSSQESWADIMVRNLHAELTANNHSVVLVGPTKHCTDSADANGDPTPLNGHCEFNSCFGEAGSARGHNQTQPELTWLNGHPQACMRFGVESVGPSIWGGGPPQLAVAGPSGSTVVSPDWEMPFRRWSATAFSAAWAARWGRVPAIAFGSSGHKVSFPWNATKTMPYHTIYPKLAAQLVQEIAFLAEKPLIDADLFLNVNFPDVYHGFCEDPAEFKWVLTRAYKARFWWGILEHYGPAVEHCGRDRLVSDRAIEEHMKKYPYKCLISVTVMDSWFMEASRFEEIQEDYIRKLSHLWHCPDFPYD
ncbi:survival protein surE domain-containing protein [Purpureocillium lavendulum]|uniref:Survival protein surE domain-containing protein n=1 Tax=Purpureocillium lavendulum TaxID=1247861 RepID=A0AB34FFH3_9HYPO|nr:survival protein surE domain-containing protein [Purpureocillium lavendulum]